MGLDAGSHGCEQTLSPTNSLPLIPKLVDESLEVLPSLGKLLSVGTGCVTGSSEGLWW